MEILNRHRIHGFRLHTRLERRELLAYVGYGKSKA